MSGGGSGGRNHDEEMLEFYQATRPLVIMGEWDPDAGVPPQSPPARPSDPCSYEPNSDTEETSGEVEAGVEASKDTIKTEESNLLELQEELKEEGILKEDGGLAKDPSTLTEEESEDLEEYLMKKDELNYSKEYLKDNPCGTHRPSFPGPDDNSPGEPNYRDEGLYEKFKSNASCRKNLGEDD